MRSRFYHKGSAAFTIIELLVAASITVVLVGLMLQVTLASLSSWNRSSGALISKNEAQTALDYLAADLASVVWKCDGNVWLLATIQKDQVGNGDAAIADAEWSPAKPKPPITTTPGAAGSSLQLEPVSRALEDYRFGNGGVWLRFFTRQRGVLDSGSNGTAPVAVGYQIVRMKTRPGGDEYRYMFFRGRASTDATSRSTFDLGYDLAASVSGRYNDLLPARNGNDDDPDRIRRPNRFSMLANNVVDFGVRFWERGANGQLNLVFPATDATVAPAYAPDNDTRGFAATTRKDSNLVLTASNASSSTYSSVNNLPNWDNTKAMRYGFPDVADIFLRILTEDGARQLEAFETGKTIRPPDVASDNEYWWQLVEQNSKVYTQRVSLSPRPL